MNRFHVHLHVRDIEESVKFYTALFGTEPSKLKPDYAKWMLEDPCVNFAITERVGTPGLSHLGLQVDDDAALEAASMRARDASGELFVERGAHCGYAVGDKAWASDPQGVRWEMFHTYQSEMPDFGCGADHSWRENAEGERSSALRPCGTATPQPAQDGRCCATTQPEKTS